MDNSNFRSDNKRLVKNTMMLYIRMILTVGISFYTTRLILSNLGVDDYGTYNVIGGFVSMFYMVTSTMTGAVSRFLTYEQGHGNLSLQKATFYSSLNLLLLLSLLVIILGETFGLWFVNAKLNIASERIIASNWVYQFSLISFLFEMISVPYSASIVAHEKMGTFAFLTIVKVLLNLLVAILLSVIPTDKLIFYGVSLFAISIAVQLMYWLYCKSNFPECKYECRIDKGVFKNMFGYAGWSFVTVISSMLSSQGVNILLNMQFGAAVNAARGIASQINSQAGAFSKNFTMALNPQITKNYAAGNYKHTISLVCQGAKFSYLLFLLVALPCMMEIDFVLKVWLKEVPEYTSAFVELTMLYTLTDVLLNSSLVLNNSTGKIRTYQMLISTTQFFIVICSYVVMKITNSPIWTSAVMNILYLFIFIPRIQLNKRYVGLDFKMYFNRVLSKVLFVTVCVFVPTYFVHCCMDMSWLRLILTTITSIVMLGIFTYIIALTEDEKIMLKQCVINKIHKL